MFVSSILEIRVLVSVFDLVLCGGEASGLSLPRGVRHQLHWARKRRKRHRWLQRQDCWWLCCRKASNICALILFVPFSIYEDKHYLFKKTKRCGPCRRYEGRKKRWNRRTLMAARQKMISLKKLWIFLDNPVPGSWPWQAYLKYQVMYWKRPNTPLSFVASYVC